MSRLLRQSLSLRLLVIFLLFGALFAWGIMMSIRWVYNSDDLRTLISGHLSLHVDYVRNDIGDPPDISRALAITESVPVDIRIEGPSVSWASDPHFPKIEQLEFAASRYFSADPDAWLYELENVEFAEFDDHRFMKIRQGQYDIIVSTTKIADDTRAPPLLPIVIGMGLLLVLITYLAVRWLFLPIRDIRYGAARIGKGDFEYRIDRVRSDELGELAADVNTLASDVQGMLDAKRQLLLGISHELRTPLSRQKLALEFIDDDETRANLRIDLDEMESIIATLLEAERLNDRHAMLHKSEVRPLDLINEILDDFFSREREFIDVQVKDDDWSVNIDEPRVKLLIKNLVSNALRYSPQDEPRIVIEIKPQDDKVLIAVADNGPGFPEGMASHVGEPFWRGDPSRTRDTGGSGLGLYIAKLVARAHGGTLALDEQYTGGARFEVLLPA